MTNGFSCICKQHVLKSAFTSARCDQCLINNVWNMRNLYCKKGFDQSADLSELSQFPYARRPILLSTAQFNFSFKERKSDITEVIIL